MQPLSNLITRDHDASVRCATELIYRASAITNDAFVTIHRIGHLTHRGIDILHERDITPNTQLTVIVYTFSESDSLITIPLLACAISDKNTQDIITIASYEFVCCRQITISPDVTQLDTADGTFVLKLNNTTISTFSTHIGNESAIDAVSHAALCGAYEK